MQISKEKHEQIKSANLTKKQAIEFLKGIDLHGSTAQASSDPSLKGCIEFIGGKLNGLVWAPEQNEVLVVTRRVGSCRTLNAGFAIKTIEYKIYRMVNR